MDSRLKYYVADDCLKRFAEEYLDNNTSMDLEDICSKKRKKTFFVMENAPERHNPMTLITMEKHNNNFYCIKSLLSKEITP